MKLPALNFSLSLLCAACAGQPATVAGPGTSAVSVASASNPLRTLADFTVADLQAASIDAKAQTPPDTAASQCYDYLASVVPTLKAPAADQPGAFLAFQKARDLANGVTASDGLLKTLNLACAPLVIDTQTVVSRLLAVGAGVAAARAAAAPLAAALPAFGAVLPIPVALP